MAKGGARPGSGRPKGAINRVSAAKREALVKGGETPLDYMLRVMRDADADSNRRDDMAKAAGPYVHAKLAAVEVTGKGGEPLQVVISSADARL
jgi:hypothetical protein